ncbi:hypothetical protein [Nonomuraea typhae]|uniref:hypothetical protein n=1 Tax=Nonomuraea typhae TaxID=2603600 RepID=UPI0012FB609D|nr:hypothetical protein [Nonomuraea typhae]
MPERLRNTTRYLAAAAYLDTGFRDRALTALIGRRHHAVAPSVGGFDLGPVLRHCLYSRSLLTVRDAAVTVMLALTLIFNAAGAAPWLIVMSVLAILAPGGFGSPGGRQRRGKANPVSLVVALVGGLLVVSTLVVMLTRYLDIGAAAEGEAPATAWLAPVMFFGAIGTVLAYRVRIYRILSETLYPGAGRTGAEAGPRMTEITLAQRGNLTLYSGENPFVGAGDLVRAWTIAAELDRRADAGDRAPAEVDAVELHRFVGERLSQMGTDAAPGMPVHLEIRDHVIAQGRLNQLHGEHPLLEDTQPRYQLSDAELHAIIRNSQAGARHYRWIVVGTSGTAVTDARGEEVLPAEERDATVSVLIHMAVEGRMLYTEFIVMALPPVRAAYRVVDELPRAAGATLVLAAFKRSTLALARDLMAAPLRLLVRGITAMSLPEEPEKFVVYDYGARLSVRELAAERGISTFLEELDAFKYAKLVEERLNNAVLDFLEHHGVDTAAYRQQIAAVINNGTVVNGGTFTGSTIGGQGAKFAMQGATS